jgi:peroxiredoxin Q/BCP
MARAALTRRPAEFCTDKKLTFPLLSDATGEVSKSYGADLSIPFLGKFSDRQTFLINAKGVIVAKWKENDGSMASVKSPAHTEQILAAIAAQKA